MSKVPETVTARFIESVEKREYFPWQKPWEMIPQRNAITEHSYTGINPLMTLAAGHACPYWASFKQLKSKGYTVLKGSTGTPIVFYGNSTSKDHAGNIKVTADGTAKSFRFLRYFTVFNLEQTDMPIPEKDDTLEAVSKLNLTQPHLPTIEYGDSRAFYNRGLDTIHIPYLAQFNTEIELYSTIYHELIHSTMHKSRLDREIGEGGFGSESYSFEELIAEIGAAILCQRTGNHDKAVWENSVSYVQGWKRALSDNPDWLIRAGSTAEKAANYILNGPS